MVAVKSVAKEAIFLKVPVFWLTLSVLTLMQNLKPAWVAILVSLSLMVLVKFRKWIVNMKFKIVMLTILQTNA